MYHSIHYYMYHSIERKTTILSLRNSISRPLLPRSFLLIAVALACLGLWPAPKAFGVTPAPDGGYNGANTAEGDNALQSLTTGVWNTALGYQTLFNDTTGNQNTATGFQALFSNTTGGLSVANGAQALYNNTTGTYNTATGFRALYSNTTGQDNVANGYLALSSNTTGYENTANGNFALYSNTEGITNTATGFQALYSNSNGYDNAANGNQALYSITGGYENTANGSQALYSSTTGQNNVADGFQALYHNTTGVGNTAYGTQALWRSTTGDANIAVGISAGDNIITGSSNIEIGNEGVAGDDGTIRIGNSNHTTTFIAGISGAAVTGTAVVVNSAGQLGTLVSSARFKQNIQAMSKSSDVLLSLRPVTFRYKEGIDPKGLPQFGLVAEEVAKVDPDLVARDAQGEPYTVRYEAVNAMLLNEFLKEHRKVEEQEAAITQLKSTVAQQQKEFQATATQQQDEIRALTAGLKEQASRTQKVSAQLELTKPAPQMAGNDW
jgi:hypothetical protein